MAIHVTTRKLLALAAGTALLSSLPLGVAAQGAADFPNKPIELVVPFGAGGGTDVLARVIAEAAKKHTSQAITVLNKPGASGGIGLTEVALAKPDGYKIAMVTAEMAIIPHLGIMKPMPDDFTPIVRLNADPIVLTVRAEAPWNTIEEFVEAAKKSKDPMKFGNAGTGGLSHLSAEALSQKIGTSFSHVPFQGNAPAVVALLGSHIDAVTSSPSEVSTYVNSGKLRALGVFADQRFKGVGFEQVPTLKERKIDLSMGTWRGLAAPKNVPADVMEKLSGIFIKAANEPAVQESMEKQNLGYSVVDGATFRKQIMADSALFKQLIDKLGVK
ncbi:tripartite tricarboxylate transporter substrate binding protein [Variovorax sp. HJSM1_2]|uniref:tripartite tricarboxylate transporter substrate binding protein n=1 Tax=Variovorax sp. HJSM1_2 TaxID=3366263 RepID=UPI003BD01FF1